MFDICDKIYTKNYNIGNVRRAILLRDYYSRWPIRNL